MSVTVPAVASSRSRARRSLARARGDFLASVAPPLGLTIAVLLVWEVVVRVAGVKSYLLPPPSQIAAELWEQRSLLIDASGVTLVEIVAGFLAAVAFSVPMAMAIVAWKPLERAVYPLLVISQTVPKIAVAPLFVIWFGFTSAPKILTAFLICFFPIVIDTIVGLRSVSSDSVDLLRSMGASRLQTFRELRLPASLPYLFAGLKVAVTLAVIGAVVGEFVASESGLGYEIINANANLNTPMLFAAMTVLTVIGLVLFYAIEALEHLLVPWHITRREGAAAGTA